MAFKRSSKPNLPNFVQTKVDQFFEHRVAKIWDNGDLLYGKCIPKKDSVVINNNDYLCLSANEDVGREQKKTIDMYGSGQMMSGTFRNTEDLQYIFEGKMANFLNTEDSLLTQSGWKANVGLIQSIADKDTVVYIDMFAHMSMWEGGHSASAKVVPFLHNDMKHLRKKIKSNGPGVICVDSIYSTDGSECPLLELADLAEEFKCCLIVDESHSLGTHGDHGEGLVSKLGIGDKVQFITASLSKAFCSRAGIITCSTKQKKYFSYTSRPAIFSSVVTLPEVSGMIKMIDVVKEASPQRSRLMKNADYIRSRLLEMGFDLDNNNSQIIGLKCGTDTQVVYVRDFLNNLGIFGSIFAAPATPANRSIYRLSISSELTLKELDKVLFACERLKDEGAEFVPKLLIRNEGKLKRFLGFKIKNKDNTELNDKPELVQEVSA
ncbi:quorum-sensing autoinducer CAI-1 synthase [Bacteriovoracaceae bacterium]|nr:quorum-sensing autoinducer CAI-1 synthase [Bacteriovoracaceae bacterium]